MRTIHGMEYYIGTHAERLGNIPGLQPGHEFYETDTNKRFWYTGSEWIERAADLAFEGRGVAANRPAVDDVQVGYVYWSIDTGIIAVNDGSAWKTIGEV